MQNVEVLAGPRASLQTLSGASSRRSTSPSVSTLTSAFPPTAQEREARERQQADPGAWCAPREPFAAARYDVRVEVDAEQSDALRRATGDLRLYAGSRATFSLVHGGGWSRLDLGEGLLATRSVIVRSPHGATLFLDPGLRAFLHLAPSQRAAWRERPITALRVGEATVDASGIRRVVVEAEGARAIIDLDPAPALRAFAADALSQLLGIAGNDIAEDDRPELAQLVRIGFPIAGSTWLPGAGDGPPTLRWSIHDVSVVSADPEQFDVPVGWTDLRDARGVERIAPRGGYATELITEARSNFATPIDPSWDVSLQTLEPVGVGPADGGNQDALGTCIESRFGMGAGLHVGQRLLDDVGTLLNVALKRVISFRGENGKITVDWMKQLRDFSSHVEGEDGVYHMLRWSPNPEAPWPPSPTDSPALQEAKRIDRFGGIGLVDRAAERGARRLLADGQQAQLILPAALLAACNSVVADPGVAPAARFDRLAPDEQAQLREAYAEQRIGWLQAKYKTEGKIQELPKGDAFPADLVRYKLFDLSLGIELHPPGEDVDARGDVLRRLFVSGPNSITGQLRLFRIHGNAIVLRWPGTAFGAFGAGVWLSCLFVPVACAALAPLAAISAWLVLDAASVEITLRSPRVDFVVSWIPDPGKKDQLLYPTVQTAITTTSRSVVYVSAVPDGLHEIIMAVISLGLSFSDEVEDALADEIKDLIQDALRDDARLVYPPGQGGLGQQIESVGAFAGTPERLGFGAHYLRPEHAILPRSWATQVDPLATVLDRADRLEALYQQAFPSPQGKDLHPRPYAVLAWSVNLLNGYLWTRWIEQRFDLRVPAEPLGAALAAAVAVAYPSWHPHRDAMRLLSAAPPRIELTPWTFAGGQRQGPLPAAPFGDDSARVVFDDLRLCGPLEGSEAVLELGFAATVVADVGLGSVRDGRLDLFGSPDLSFEVLFDLPSVTVGPWSTASTRVKDGPVATPLGVDDLHTVLTDAVRAMLTPWPATAVTRVVGDERNVQRYGIGPLALGVLMAPAGGYLYAYLGLPRLADSQAPEGYDPVVWLADPDRIPQSRESARSLLRYVHERFSGQV